MVFVTSGKMQKVRLSRGDGSSVVLSTGYHDLTDAEDVEAALRLWEGRKGVKPAKPTLVAALLEKRVTLREAYDAHLEGRLADLIERVNREVSADAERLAQDASDPDLSPVVEEWHAWKAKQQKKPRKSGNVFETARTSTADDYHRKVRVMYPIGTELRASRLKPPAIAARIDLLDVQGPTKNRYRTAISQFCKYLVRRGLLAANPVRDVDGFGENEERVVYYEIPDGKTLLAGMAQPFAAISAFALGFGAEWEAITSARGNDLVIEGKGKRAKVTALVRGSKKSWRVRSVTLVPELMWLLPYIRDAFAAAGTGHVFPGLQKWTALRAQRDVATQLKLKAVGEERFSQHDLHDWRHTHAVALLRWRYAEQIVASHLGHKNTDLVRTRYGVFLPTSSDYAKV